MSQINIEGNFKPCQNNHSREVAIQNVRLHMEKQWTLKEETSEHFLMVRTKVSIKGHLIVAIIFGWWLIFIPNLIYHILMKESKKIPK